MSGVGSEDCAVLAAVLLAFGRHHFVAASIAVPVLVLHDGPRIPLRMPHWWVHLLVVVIAALVLIQWAVFHAHTIVSHIMHASWLVIRPRLLIARLLKLINIHHTIISVIATLLFLNGCNLTFGRPLLHRFIKSYRVIRLVLHLAEGYSLVGLTFRLVRVTQDLRHAHLCVTWYVK